MKHAHSSIAGSPKADPSWRIGIVCSSFYKEEIERLLKGAVSVLEAAGIPDEHVLVEWVAGSFEIPLIGRALASGKKTDALIGLGIVVEGETHHARLLSEQTARGIMDVQMQYGVPFAFEILYVQTLRQAQERSEGEQNKGKEAARSVLHSLAILKRLQAE